MENTPAKRFHYHSEKDWTTKDWGRNAIIGILGGGILGRSGIIVWEVVGDVVGTLGLICAIYWIVRKVQKKP